MNTELGLRPKLSRTFSPCELAECATWALREEALLTPKPGLVDGRGSGAHRDMDLPMLLRSAAALTPTFARLVECATDAKIDSQLRQRLAKIGLEGECAMLAVTGGVNTHRGAIWSLGLLCAAAAGLDVEPFDIGEICERAARIARLPAALARGTSHGYAAFLRHGARGARGEAEDAFPSIRAIGLPTLRAARVTFTDENAARLQTLIALVAEVDDTCLLHRGGREALAFAQTGAQRVLNVGIQTHAGRCALTALDRGLVERNASPGGCADLLAVTLFLDRLNSIAENRNGNA